MNKGVAKITPDSFDSWESFGIMFGMRHRFHLGTDVCRRGNAFHGQPLVERAANPSI